MGGEPDWVIDLWGTHRGPPVGERVDVYRQEGKIIALPVNRGDGAYSVLRCDPIDQGGERGVRVILRPWQPD